MEKINCATSNCEHNIKGVCLAGVISIGENAKCLSRIKREGGLRKTLPTSKRARTCSTRTSKVWCNVPQASVRSTTTVFAQTLKST